MKIYLERTGGFTGIPLHIELDTQNLEPAQGEYLAAALDAANFFDLPVRTVPSQETPDQFHYMLIIENSERVHAINASESELPEEMRNLIRYIIRLGRKKDKK